MTNHEIWQAVLAEFELKISKANFMTWFKDTGISNYSQGHIVVAVPTAFAKSYLEKKYHIEIIRALERITSEPIKKIEYHVENIKMQNQCGIQETHNEKTSEKNMRTNDRRMPVDEFGLNIKYTFATFIVGKNNELAHAAARAVAERPGDVYNPLFIYGGVGLGKTHLLQAIGHAMREKNPDTKILYASSEKFISDFVSLVKEGRAKDFKDRYRTVDLMLIDDIQFIGGKEQTQEEFFHTFNELHQHGKQVVMTSDRPPKAIPALEDRLRSRFEWGMIADVGAPDLETRVAILEQKCQEKNYHLEPECIQLIATTIQSNIRELEGALNKIMAFYQLKNINPTKEALRAALIAFEAQGKNKSITPKELIAEVTRFYDVNLSDILGKSREKKLSFPRQVIMYLLRSELQLSYPNIGDELGGRDHTTAIHAHTKIGIEMENDMRLKQDIEMIKQRLYATAV